MASFAFAVVALMALLAVPSGAAAAPETTIGDALPASPILTPSIPVTSNAPTATFQCRVNGAPAGWAGCNPSSGTYGSGVSFVSSASNAVEIRAVDSGVPDPTPATTYIWTDTSSLLPGLTMTTSNTRAALKADLQLDLTVKGGYNPKSLNFDLPPGLTVAYTATNQLCTLSSAAAGTCASTAPQSLVGSASAVGVSPSSGTWAAASAGSLYLTESPSSNAPGGIAIELPAPGGLGSIRAVGEIRIAQTNNGTSGGLVRQKLYFPSVPQATSIGTRLHLNSLRLNLTGDPVGGSWRFIANPTSCPATAAQFIATGTTYGADGSNESAGAPIPPKSVGYPVTNCSSTSFKPAIASEFFQTDPLDGSTYDFNDPAASLVNVGSSLATAELMNSTRTGDFGLGTSIFNAYTGRRLKHLKFSMDFSGGLYPWPLGSASQRCTGAGVNATSVWPAVCPASGIAQVGSIQIYSPLFSDPIVGSVSAISKAPMPWFGIDVNPNIPGNPPGVTMRFLIVPDFVGPTLRTVFYLRDLPDMPFTFDLDLSGQTARAGGLLSSLIFTTTEQGDQDCVSAGSIRAEFTSSSSEATPSVRTQDVSVGPC